VYHFGDSSFYEQCCVDLCTPCFDFHHNDLTVDVSSLMYFFFKKILLSYLNIELVFTLTQGDEKARNESALNYIVIAANGGHAGAQTKLGECYALGKYGMEEGNWKEARKWYGGGVVVGCCVWCCVVLLLCCVWLCCLVLWCVVQYGSAVFVLCDCCVMILGYDTGL